jgi:hypothetical protein
MTVQRQVGSQTDCQESATDLRGKENRFAKRVAGPKFAVAGAGEKVAGIISEGKNVGLHTSINTGNQLRVVAGAALAVGDVVQSDAEGRAIVGTTNPAGTVIFPASAAGVLAEIELDRV